MIYNCLMLGFEETRSKRGGEASGACKDISLQDVLRVEGSNRSIDGQNVANGAREQIDKICTVPFL